MENYKYRSATNTFDYLKERNQTIFRIMNLYVSSYIQQLQSYRSLPERDQPQVKDPIPDNETLRAVPMNIIPYVKATIVPP